MAHDITPFHAEQSRIVRELFVDTADDNYITARWCFVEGLNVDYFWLSVHALEKYMKAALLLNGHSAKDFGHNIVALYERVRQFASDLLPSKLTRPDDLEISHWRDETLEAFLRRFHDNGNADNRYQIFGFIRRSEDLFKLDAMVFVLRRLCVPLDAYFMERKRSGRTSQTHRDILRQKPGYWTVFHNCTLKVTADGTRGECLRDVLLNLNLPFTPDDFAHQDLRTGTASRNPVLSRWILKPLEQAPGNANRVTAEKLRDWVVNNIRLPPDVEEQLRSAG